MPPSPLPEPISCMPIASGKQFFATSRSRLCPSPPVSLLGIRGGNMTIVPDSNTMGDSLGNVSDPRPATT